MLELQEAAPVLEALEALEARSGRAGTFEVSLAELNESFREYVSSEQNAEEAAGYIYDSLLEDVTTGALFDFHHGLKTGLADLVEGEPEDVEPLLIVNSPECDVFGFSVVKKTPDSNCACPNCERPVSATRFAPHLEKCMGMGRNSSRIASRRIASNSREPTSYAGLLSDDEDDADWSGASTGPGERRKKRVRNHGQRKSAKMQNGSRTSNGVNAEAVTASEAGSTDTTSNNDRKNSYQQICGVVSEHTKKLCTRSLRCPQHTDEQRRMVRNSREPATPEAQGLTADDAGSPPDSSPSSSCSSSSRKRDRHRGGKSKSKRERATTPSIRE